MRSMRYPRDPTIEELLGELFTVRSVPRCYNQEKSRFQLVERLSAGRKDVNTEGEEATALEAVTRRQPKETED
jgi:hypothetical protein